jgi:LuxR family maltose regulon positive regulatory protein
VEERISTEDTPSGTSLGDQLLTTKLYAPFVKPNLVTRRRLTERLDEGAKGNLTLISAPAGFGKTTLLGEWILQSESPIAWVSLDEGDNDLGRFLAYAVAALDSLQPGVAEDVLEPLHSPQPPPIESILTALVNDIATIPGDFALVLDDYHAIEARPVHDAVAFLLDHMPPQMHLIMTSRTDPPLPLARLLARGHLTKLSAADLMFTPEEAVVFLNEAMGVDLSSEDVAALEERTEGWVAGLQLAALSMQGRQDIPDFVAAFAGSNHYILDYLGEEVLRKQSENIQSFLLETSVLDRLSGPLCDAVTGRDDGRATLEDLERANLFLVPLDDDRRWYRYHHLFSDFLRERLRRTYSEWIPALHRRACGWYERNELPGEAVGHALAAGDTEWAANLVERIARTTLRRGELNTLRRWLEALPEDLVCVRPRLCLSGAWYSLATGQLDEVEPYLSKVEDKLDGGNGGRSAVAEEGPGEDAREILGEAATIRAAAVSLTGDSSRAIDLARRADALLTEGNLFLRAIIAASLGFAHRAEGDVASASRAFAEAATISRSAGSTYVALLASKNLTELLLVQGRLRAAADVCRQALDLALERGKRLPASGVAHVGMGELLREWDELDAATDHLLQGIELSERGGDVELVIDGHVALARTQQALGDQAEAADTLQSAQRLAQRRGTDEWVARVKAWQARLWVAQGDRWAAARWSEECGLSVEDELSYPRELEHITLARVLIAQAKHDEAVRLLERLLRAAEACGRWGRAIEILTLKALILQAQDDEPGAVAALQRALALAEPEGYVRTFANEGAPMVSLLSSRKTQPASTQRGASPEYVGKLLLATLGRDAPPSAGARGRSRLLVESISEREVEVLQLLASGISNQEIAAKLFVSLDTVKTHLKHIYGKLGVHNRAQAVARAEELGLI